MITKKLLIFTLALYCTNLNCSAPAATCSAMAATKQAQHGFIVIPKDSEEIVSHLYGSTTQKTKNQRVHIYCIDTSQPLNNIKSSFSINDKVKPKDQVTLNSIIQLIIPVITKKLKKGSYNHPGHAFLVDGNTVYSCNFNENSHETFKVFELENNPIPSEWFSKS
ncbi:MAG: hypothetical protein P4L31_08200 [Candidatus Babeliales bacterium]|nr:hypothetical protein [Candidatus Babeliales bacterium]